MDVAKFKGCDFFSLTLKLWYDQLFKGKHGNDSVNVLRSVVNLMQDFFLWPSLKTTFTLSVLEVKEIPVSLTNYASDATL